MRRAVASATVAMLLGAACGGRSALDPYTSPNGPSSGGFEAGVDGASLDLCAPDGIRICGNGCPALVTPDSGTFDVDAGDICPGYGCLPTEDIRSFAAQAAGVCWADGQPEDAYRCGTCRDGEVCLQRSATELVCVPEDVCRALWTLGVRDVCRYTDFHPYDGRPVPTPAAACPISNATDLVCAGSCPACSSAMRCVGRSPDHPFGLCNGELLYGTDPTPADFLTCDECFSTLGPAASMYACAVFDSASVDLSVAKAGGFCMRMVDCLRIAPSFPGGLSCFDATGNRVGP